MIGLLMMQLAKNAGATKVVLLEPVEGKREVALKLGADLAIDSIHEDVPARLEQEASATSMSLSSVLASPSPSSRPSRSPATRLRS